MQTITQQLRNFEVAMTLTPKIQTKHWSLPLSHAYNDARQATNPIACYQALSASG